MSEHTLTPEQLAEYAATPRKVVGDEGSIEERTATEFIDLDRYAHDKEAMGKAPFGMTIARVRPNGTV